MRTGISEFRAVRLIVNWNTPETINEVVFVDRHGEELLVMFEEWGFHTPENLQPVKLAVNCGGIVIAENEEGELRFSPAFLASDPNCALVVMQLEEIMKEIIIQSDRISFVIVDEDGECSIDMGYKRKTWGTRKNQDGVILPVLSIEFSHELPLIVQGQIS